jgi:DNA-binding MarR family transcriptional regulator
VRLLGLLRLEGPATATGLAGKVGESSGTTSYHLRQLAAADLIVEDTGRGNARERWWRAAQDSTEMHGEMWADDPEMKPVADAYMGAILTAYTARARAFLDTADSWPRRWQRASEMSDYNLSLTAAETTRLNAAVRELLESFQREPRKGDASVAFQFQSFPWRAS